MHIKSHKHAYQYLKKQISLEVEEFWCLALASNLKLIEIKLLFRGTVDFCTIHPRDIFRFGCATNASKLIVAHSHPSGDKNPSTVDVEITHRLVQISQLIEIPIIDHLIVTEKSYLSMAEKGLLQ
jgi:DNA repair protein RadC